MKIEYVISSIFGLTFFGTILGILLEKNNVITIEDGKFIIVVIYYALIVMYLSLPVFYTLCTPTEIPYEDNNDD